MRIRISKSVAFTLVLITSLSILSFNIPPSDDLSPCELIGPGYIMELFELKEDPVQEQSKSSFPTCTYSWKGDRFKMMKMGPDEIKLTLPSEVMVIIGSRSASENEFRVAAASYVGQTAETEVGDKAIWGFKRNQMTVLSGTNLFHVKVSVWNDPAKNMEKAIEVCSEIIEKFE